MQKHDNDDLVWRGDQLALKGTARTSPIVKLIQDANYSGMWRIKTPDGAVSDLVNRARAREAARSTLLGILRQRLASSEVPPVRSAA
jgi:hypothetical protein